MLGHGFMPGMDEYDRVKILRFGQSSGSRFDGIFLDVESPYPADFPHQPGQQEGVMTVAAGGVNDMVSMRNKPVDKQVRKRDRPAQ